MERLLVVEDDPMMREILAATGDQQGLAVVAAGSVAAAHEALTSIDSWALALVDVDLPDGTGFAVLEEAHAAFDLPVIVVTAHWEADLRVRAFEEGADDYVVKPFLVAELEGRMRAVLRRTAAHRHTRELRVGPWVIDQGAQTVRGPGGRVDLARRELQLLAFLARTPGRVFSREELLRHVWQSSAAWQDPRTVNEHVRRLRHKLGPEALHWVRTVPGEGYLVAAE